MCALRYINFHTHKPDNGEFISIRNCIAEKDDIPSNESFFSYGFHPWHMFNSRWNEDQFVQIASQKNCLFIGECGLDKLIGPEQQIQKEIFQHQCKVAKELNKPIVVHAVQSHYDCLKILKENSIEKAIFHGFNNNLNILSEILKNGFSVSFGEALLNKNSPAYIALLKVPFQNFFLETDDSLIPIPDIYECASQIKNISIEKMIQLQHKIFNFYI